MATNSNPVIPKEFSEIKHKTVSVNGIKMHIAEKGEATNGTILFLHGFPELWYSWRHQLLGLSSAGYRAIAPDLRGYGETDSPPSIESYTIFHIVGDIIALLDYLVVDKVFLVGHDWGTIVAWYLCLFKPDRVKALVNLSVPFMPRDPNKKTVQMFRDAFGDDFYICRFQEPGVMEKEYAAIDTEKVMKFCFSLKDPSPAIIPEGALGKAAEQSTSLPSWLSEADNKYYAETFKKTGFTGGLNYYRNIDKNWELMAAWTGSEVKVPTKFIMGELDMTYNFPGMKDYIHKGGFRRDVPLLENVVIMEGVGHFINQEKKEEINKHIRDFFLKF